MRLTGEQKLAVFESLHGRRPGGRLVRIRSAWAVVWHEPEQARGERWRGQLITRVVGDAVWWRPEVGGVSRRAVLSALAGEVDFDA